MSVRRSAKVGTFIGNTFILKNRSALKSPLSTFFSRSLWVAQISLRSILMSSAPPTLWIVLLSIALNSLAWRARGMSPISSRNSEPPLDCSNLPFLNLSAPVNEPFSWPNNSDSKSSDGIAAQLTVTKEPFFLEHLWIARATTSFPVPVSPKINAVLSVCETIAIKFFIDLVSELLPSIISLRVSSIDLLTFFWSISFSTTFIY